MAESVIATARYVLKASRYVLLLIASAGPASVVAEALPDPTRPPAALASRSGVASGDLSANGTPAAVAGPVLQSVLISPGRRVAVISGQTVQVGDRIDGMRITRIAEGEVVLNDGKDSRVLKLFPGIEKRQISAGKQPK